MARTDRHPGDWLVGGGELGELIRSMDWSATPLGARDAWPQYLRTVVNLVVSSNFPMAILWGSDLIFIYNDAYSVIAEDRHPRALGRSTRDVWPEAWAFNRPIFERVMSRGESVALKGQLFRIVRHGEVQNAYFTLSCSPIRSEASQVAGTMVVLLETTLEESQLASANLDLAAQNAFRALTDHSPDSVDRFDRTFRHVYINAVAAAVAGRTPEEVIGKTNREIGVADATATLWEERLRHVFETGEPLEVEDTFPSSGGLRFYHTRCVPETSADGVVQTVLAVSRDTTDRRRAAVETLREREEGRHAILQTAMDGFWLTDLQGRLLEVNETYCGMSGYSEQELLAMRIPDLEATESSADTAGHIQRIIAQGMDRFESHHRRKDGSIFDVEVSVQYRTSDGGRLVTFLRDITERRSLDHQLAQSHLLLSNLARLVPGVIYQYRLYPDGRSAFPYSSPGMNDIYEVTPDEVREDATPVFGRLHPDDYDDVAHAIQESARTLQTFYCEFRVVLPRQGLRWRWSQAQPERTEDGGTLWHGIILDITERKRAEATLIQAKDFAENLILTANVIFVELNIGGEVVRLNPDAERITGYSQADVVGKNWFEVLVPRVRYPHVWAEFERITARGEVPRTFENPIRTKSGEERHIVWQNSLVRRGGGVAGTISFGVDITDRKRAEEAFRLSEERLSLAMMSARQGLWDWDIARDEAYLSPVYLEMIGYGEHELPQGSVLRLFESLVHPDDYAKVSRAMQALLEGTSEHSIAEYRLRTKSGEDRWVRGIGRIVARDDKGAPLRMVGTVTDITENKQAEEIRASLEGQLQQAQKMESVGRLAGGVAHDFNNMLGVILGHTEIAIDQVDPAQPLRASLDEIHKAAKRSTDLTRQLLAFARKQTVTPRVIDLNETVAGTLSMLRRLIGEDIRLTWHPGAGLWPVKIDPSQLDQILANLCVNARDAIAGVGTITIATRNDAFDDDRSAGVPGMVFGDYVVVEVADDGCGMDVETLDHIFEPFFTTKGVGQGTGLGLASVYGAVKQNGGSVDVRSTPGSGTTFTIYLPRTSDTAKFSDAEHAAGPAVRGHETILLVEDEPSILNLTTMVLTRQGYNVLAASTPGEAIRLADEHAGRIHLLMTDVVMPEMSGRTLTKQLLSARPDVKCLFMSGYTADVIAHRGVMDAGVSFLQKPFSIAAVAAKVRETLDRE
ncbi:MAG: PAS domain S-box protein [Acidobacteriota bacterium]